jgi:hypothetical protein
VDFNNCQIRLNPGTTKNKKGRTLPIYGHMRECFTDARVDSRRKAPRVRAGVSPRRPADR